MQKSTRPLVPNLMQKSTRPLVAKLEAEIAELEEVIEKLKAGGHVTTDAEKQLERLNNSLKLLR
jgi:exonuclease VII small subunit